MKVVVMRAGSYPGAMRASDQDRAVVQTVLNDAFAEGRLTKDEWEQRASALGGAATYADLDRLTHDLPRQYPGPRYGVPPPPPPLPARRSQSANATAAAALACGLGQLLVGFPAGIAAILLGYRAQRTIRQTGEPGAGMARAGIVLGYLGVGLTILAVVAMVLLAGVAVRSGVGVSQP